MQGVRGSNPLSSTLGLDEHGRAQQLAVTSSASDRAIALTWQMAPWRSIGPGQPGQGLVAVAGQQQALEVVAEATALGQARPQGVELLGVVLQRAGCGRARAAGQSS